MQSLFMRFLPNSVLGNSEKPEDCASAQDWKMASGGGCCQRWAECTQLRSSNAEESKFLLPRHSLSLLPCASLSSSCSHPQHCLLPTMTLYCFPNSVWELNVEFWILSWRSRKVKVRPGKERSVVSIHPGFDWQPLSQEKPRFLFLVLHVHQTTAPH